jgi:hypothetical protein
MFYGGQNFSPNVVHATKQAKMFDNFFIVKLHQKIML